LGDNDQLSDEDLSVFLELSTELFGVFEPLGGLVWCNPSVATVLGYRPDELQQIDLATLVHPDDLGAPTDDLEDFPRDGSALTLEVRCRAKDGTWRWLEWSGTWDPEHSLLYGAARDVTERRQRRAALVRNEKLINSILDHSEAAISVVDDLQRYVLVNEAFARLAGKARSEIVGRTVDEVWMPRPVPGIEAARDVLDSGEPVTTDEVIDMGDGPHTFMTTRFPVQDDAGAVIGTAAFATDISSRSALEQRLAERQRLLDTIVNASPDIVIILDAQGRVTEVSRAAVRILGQETDHLVHESLAALVHPDDLPAVHEEYQRLVGGEQRQLEMRYRVAHRDGHWVTLATRGRAVVSEDGRAGGAVVVSRDVTADLAVEAELERALAEAERASLAKSTFLSRMSHELRTPLNSVLGFAQLLQLDGVEGEQAQAVGHILRAGQHLLNLIDEVLDITRIESGRLDLVLGPVSVADVVADAVNLTRPLAEDRGIDVSADLRGLPLGTHVQADRQRLLQVLLNLLSNGVKYNHADGAVVISAAAQGAEVRLSVADTGPGIAPEDSERVFRPFDRLGAERSSVQGTGVGLALSKHLVEQMGGTIALGSAPGRGAVFTVVMVRVAGPGLVKSADEPGHKPTEGPGALLRVLHIEDNLANLELVEQILSRVGAIDLRAAMYGSLGLELAREHRPDLVLLDLHLPDMPGADLLQQLRAAHDTAEVPVVVVSADATPDQIRLLHASGAMAYLTKPIDVHELVRVVELVRSRSSTAGLAR
jgi:PAS domain S-box-containing protein